MFPNSFNMMTNSQNTMTNNQNIMTHSRTSVISKTFNIPGGQSIDRANIAGYVPNDACAYYDQDTVESTSFGHDSNSCYNSNDTYTYYHGMGGSAHLGQPGQMTLEDRNIRGDSMVSEWDTGFVMPDSSGGDIVSIVDNGFKKYFNL